MVNPFLNWRERSRPSCRDDLPPVYKHLLTGGRSNQMFDVLAALLCLNFFLAIHSFALGIYNLMVNQPPRYLGPSIHTSALVVPPQSILQIGGMTDVITAISFDLKYVDEIGHVPTEKPAVKKTAGSPILAGATRFELATFGVTGRRSNQLNYAPDY